MTPEEDAGYMGTTSSYSIAMHGHFDLLRRELSERAEHDVPKIFGLKTQNI